jgi:hypothetical protein
VTLISLVQNKTTANKNSLFPITSPGLSNLYHHLPSHLPNADKPPLFVDLPAQKNGDQLVINSKLTDRLRNSFFLESMIPQYADNLKSLRGFKFDWARSDPIQDQVYSNQAFTHKLNEFGIVHEAKEYNGAWGEPNWGENGRVCTEVLPFFGKHLSFEEDNDLRRK